MEERKHFLDNIRWITMVIVIFYHIIYLFNCSGVISNIGVQGIPIFDTFLIFVYPWFMCLLFIVSGISSRYSLQKRSVKEFLKDRVKKLLIPSTIGIFVYCWIVGLVTNQYVNMFGDTTIATPGFIKYIVYCLTGIGPLWFAHVLFISCILLGLIKKFDKNDKIWNICGKVNLPILLILVLLVWGSSFILNVPVISVYRFGIYILMFLLGYFVFSHNEILEKTKSISLTLGIISLVIGIMYVIYYYGTNFTLDSCLQSLFTNIYLWITILAILGLGQKFLNFNNNFTTYMTKNNFNFYILHYPVVVGLGYLVVTYLHLPFMLNYLVILISTLVLLPLVIEVIKRIPVIRSLVLGVYKKK